MTNAECKLQASRVWQFRRAERRKSEIKKILNDYYLGVCTIDYNGVERKCDPLIELSHDEPLAVAIRKALRDEMKRIDKEMAEL